MGHSIHSGETPDDNGRTWFKIEGSAASIRRYVWRDKKGRYHVGVFHRGDLLNATLWGVVIGVPIGYGLHWVIS